VTRAERLAKVDAAYDDALRKMGDDRALRFSCDCMKAIAGVAVLLDRDPEALAELLSDGRLAEYLYAGDSTLPLSLEEPSSVLEPIDDLMRNTAEWLESEKHRLDKQFASVKRRFDRAAEDLTKRRTRLAQWRSIWFNSRPWAQLEANARN
jgi:hypothetical protein